MAAKVGNVIVNFITNLAAFETDIKKATRSLKSMGRDFEGAGTAMTKYLSVPIAAFGAIVGKMSVDFNEGMDTIRSGTGATGKALEGLGVSMRTVMKRAPQDIASVSTAIADLNTRLGITGKPLEEMSTQLLNLARITKSEIAPLVTSSTRLFGDWSIATEKQSKTLDYLYKVSQNTGIGIQQLMELTVQYGAPLRALGFNLEQAAAMMGKWEKEGVNMETVLAGLRFRLGEFAKSGKDPIEALRQIQERIKGAKTESEATAISFKAFGKRAAVDMGRAIIEGRFDIEDLIKTLNASRETINKAADDTMSFTDKLGIFRNKVALAAEPLGNALIRALENMLPYLEKTLELVASMGAAFAALPGPIQMAVVGLAGFTAALGPMVMLIGSSITNFAAMLPLLGKLGALMGVGGVTAAAIALGAAVAGVGAAFVAWRLYESHQEMKRHWEAMSQGAIKADEFAKSLEAVGYHIDRNGLSSEQWIEKIGRIKQGMEETKEVFKQFNIEFFKTAHSAELAKISFQEATGKISKEQAAMLRGQIDALMKLEGAQKTTVVGTENTAEKIAKLREEFAGAFSPMDALTKKLGEYQSIGIPLNDVIKAFASNIVDAAHAQVKMSGSLTESQGAMLAQALYFETIRDRIYDANIQLDEYAHSIDTLEMPTMPDMPELPEAGIKFGLSGDVMAVYDAMQQSLKDKLQNMQPFLQTPDEEQLAILQGYYNDLDELRANSLISEQEYAEAKKQIASDEIAYKLSAYRNYFGNLSNLQSSHLRALAIVGKSAAIAEATINTYVGATKALAQGGIWGAVDMAIVMAMGMAQVSQIAAQGFAKGGMVPGGERLIKVNEQGSEFVMNSKATKEYLPLLQMMNNPAPINNRLETSSVASALAPRAVSVSIANYGTSKQFEVQQLDEGNIRIIARDEAMRTLSSKGPEIIANDMAYANSRTSKAIARHTTARRADR